MIDPVLGSALIVALIDAAIKITGKIVTNIDIAINNKKELAALKDTIMRIEPYLKKIQHIRPAMNQRKDEASAADNWFKELNVLLNAASETVERCTRRKLNSSCRTRKEIANFTKDIETHLTLFPLVVMFQNEEHARKILDGHRKILDGQSQIIEALASSSSSTNYTSQAAHAPVGTINRNKLSRDGPPSYESTKVFENPMTSYVDQGFVSHDFTAACAEELNITVGEEVQILYAEGEWFKVRKKQMGRDGKMEGFVPQFTIMFF